MTSTIRILIHVVIAAGLCSLPAGCSDGSVQTEPQASPPQSPAPAPTKPITKPAPAPAKPIAKPTPAPAKPPRNRFFGLDANASHIIYVVDRSGSMAPTFQQVQMEILKSIAKLKSTQDFTIILYSDNDYIEGPRKGLVLAEMKNKIAAKDFLKEITAQGSSSVLPALSQAMKRMKSADPSKPGRAVYLLSDGDFESMSGGSTYKTPEGKKLRGNQAIIQWLRDNNPKEAAKRVRIHTFLYLNENEQAKAVMKTIARENGGSFKLITPDD